MGLRRETEKSFMAAVIQFARLRGWRVYHTHDSRRSEAGFLDLVLARRRQVVFAELKVEPNKLTTEQKGWIEDLPEDGVYVWYPKDWPEIQRVLQ